MHQDRYAEVLELLADASAQDRYEAEVPGVDVLAELICMWFDDLSPVHEDPDLSEDVAAAIRNFTAFFESRVGRLPKEGGLRALRGSADWYEVTIEAHKALERVKGSVV